MNVGTQTTETYKKDVPSAAGQIQKDQQVLLLPRVEKRAPRAYVVGMTDTGKSTLMEVLMVQYMRGYSSKKSGQVRVLIVDTKPRFRAAYEMSGVNTEKSKRYDKWGYGSGVIPNSYVLDITQQPKAQFDKLWRLGVNIAIVQTERQVDWSYVTAATKSFYEDYGAEVPRLVVVDELADFFEKRSLGDIFQRVARNGRERDCALIAGSQRPRKVPVEIMTEMRDLYMFELQFIEDFNHLLQFGVPYDVTIPSGHTFYFYDRVLKSSPPSDMYYELDLSHNYWSGRRYSS